MEFEAAVEAHRHEQRLFVAPVDLQLTSIETVGEALLARYERTGHA
jgi:hypothetical protein